MTAARILIVEDNQANRALMDYLLRAFGYAVLLAEDGEQGLDMARRDQPDLILLDLQLPKMTGFDVLKRLRDRHPASPPIVVAVTAFAMVGDRERVLAHGFDAYLSKPIEPEQFVPQIEALLQARLRVARTGKTP